MGPALRVRAGRMAARCVRGDAAILVRRRTEETLVAYETEVLASQLAQLGRDLDREVGILGELEENCVEAEGEYRRLVEEYDDCLARAFLDGEGSVEHRKAAARLKCVPARLLMQEANIDLSRIKGELRTQQASLQALHRRIEVGRSLLSREKALISLAGTGET